MDDKALFGSTRESAPSSARQDVVEVVARSERRRRWSDEERAHILTEAMAPGAVVAHVARRWGVSTGQLYTWRRAMLVQPTTAAVSPSTTAPGFAQVRLAAPNPGSDPRPTPASAGVIEIVLPGGELVRVDGGVDGDALRRVLAALADR